MTELTPDLASQLEEKRWRALLEGDVESLDSMFADDIAYTHSTGRRESKSSFLEGLRSSALRYVKLEPSDRRILLVGDCAVVTGDVLIAATTAAGSFEGVVAYTAVWGLRDGSYVHIAWHSSSKAN